LPFETQAARITPIYKIYCSKCGYTAYEDDWNKAEKLRAEHPCKRIVDSMTY